MIAGMRDTIEAHMEKEAEAEVAEGNEHDEANGNGGALMSEIEIEEFTERAIEQCAMQIVRQDLQQQEGEEAPTKFYGTLSQVEVEELKSVLRCEIEMWRKVGFRDQGYQMNISYGSVVEKKAKLDIEEIELNALIETKDLTPDHDITKDARSPATK